MKKKNLAILLIIPFLVALFGIVTINTAFNLIDNDVVRINWTYRDNELFEVGQKYPLKAEGVVADSRYPASAGNRIVWTVENADGASDPHAELFSDGKEAWFLEAKSVGKVWLTCTTEKGNVTPLRMAGVIYSGNAFVINTKIDGSGQNVDSTLYYGEYDLVDGQKQRASFGIDLTLSDDSLRSGIVVDTANTTPNLNVDLAGGTVAITGVQEGLSKIALVHEENGLSADFEFEVVEGGVNVYTYEDLLACTNDSERGEIVVLRKNFESKANAENSAAGNVAMFGSSRGNGFSFAEEVYRFPTTYNSEYIQQWNNFVGQGSKYTAISNEIVAGLRVQKDFYGNGYTLNLHNLCFPTQYSSVVDSTTGATFDYYKPGPNDLFQGPKPFYLLGDPNNVPLVTAYGQDNVGVYLDGNNILFNDVKVKNCDFGLIVDNLTYAGTVVEVNGNGAIIRNSVLSNGKNVLRSFSSMNLTVENCILSTSRNFLFTTGSNRYEKNELSDTTQHTFTNLDGSTYTGTLASHLGAGGYGDKATNIFTVGFSGLEELEGGFPEYEKEAMRTALHSIQNALNHSDTINANNYDGSTEITDTIFYRSGIAAIGMETLFNGPFLYNNSPSMDTALLGILGDNVPLLPDNVSGASYPVTVNLSGNTRFFDYKTLADWDISGLIDQNISTVAGGLGVSGLEITIDDIFPLKSILTTVARSNRLIYSANESEYINIPIAFYGGGKNLSTVTTNGLTAGGLTGTYNVDLLDSYLNMNTKLDIEGLLSSGDLSSVMSNPNFMRYMKEVLTKTVTTVTGFEPFKFRFGNDPEGVFDTESGTPLAPDYRDLIKA